MTVLRIVADIKTNAPSKAKPFYVDILDLDLAMDQGFIQTYISPEISPAQASKPQISFASEGGSGTDVPDLSIEIDNFDEVLARVQASEFEITYGPVLEPWGVRRFYVRDPFDRTINILTHTERD